MLSFPQALNWPQLFVDRWVATSLYCPPLLYVAFGGPLSRFAMLTDRLQLVPLQISSFEHWPLFQPSRITGKQLLEMAFKIACVTRRCCFSSS